MKRTQWLGVAALTLMAGVLVALLASRYLVYRNPAARVCDVCRRPIHDRTRTVATFAGSAETFCCPACALTAHRQTGLPARIEALTDFDTGARLDPSTAWVVAGSDVNLCTAHNHHPVLGDDQRPAATSFDRCAPSILAFTGQKEAVAFSASHGGEVLPFPELAARFSR